MPATLIAAVLLATTCVAGLNADETAAQQPRVTYTFRNVTFDGVGGTLSGSFVFDPDTPCTIPTCSTSGAFTAVSVTTSANGSGFFAGGFSYSTGNLQNTTSPQFLSATNRAILFLCFASDLGPTGAIPLDTTGCSVEYSGAGETRYVRTGEVVGVAEGTATSSSSTSSTSPSTTSATTTPTTPTTSSAAGGGPGTGVPATTGPGSAAPPGDGDGGGSGGGEGRGAEQQPGVRLSPVG